MIDWDSLVAGPIVNVFGEPVRYMPATTRPFNIAGNFVAAYVEIDPQSGMGVTTARPMLGVQLSQFPTQPLQGDRLTILRTGETYSVNDVRDDSHGWANLILNLDP
jgi:hypothetical protein